MDRIKELSAELKAYAYLYRVGREEHYLFRMDDIIQEMKHLGCKFDTPDTEVEL